MKKRNLMYVCMFVMVTVVCFNMFWNMKQSFNVSKLILANIEALADAEGGTSGGKCYTEISRVAESKIDGYGNEKMNYECEYHSCVHGSGSTCTTGSRCTYYHDIYTETVGSIYSIYC